MGYTLYQFSGTTQSVSLLESTKAYASMERGMASLAPVFLKAVKVTGALTWILSGHPTLRHVMEPSGIHPIGGHVQYALDQHLSFGICSEHSSNEYVKLTALGNEFFKRQGEQEAAVAGVGIIDPAYTNECGENENRVPSSVQ